MSAIRKRMPSFRNDRNKEDQDIQKGSSSEKPSLAGASGSVFTSQRDLFSAAPAMTKEEIDKALEVQMEEVKTVLQTGNLFQRELVS
jgi:hypothetical protein